MSNTLSNFFADLSDDDLRFEAERQEVKRKGQHASWARALARTATLEDWQLLVGAGIAVAEYDDPDSERPTAYHLKGVDPNENIYSDQADIEEK